jgi:hypothetical protein
MLSDFFAWRAVGSAVARGFVTDFCGDEKNRLFLAGMTRQSFREFASIE